jgi:hypothetical protein
MSADSGNPTVIQEADATKKLDAAVTPTRSLLFYTLTATIPILVITAVLLFTKVRGKSLTTLAVLGAITGFIGMGRILYELTLDIAGYPDYKLPVWSVFYLIIYIISAFSFVFFAMHRAYPGRYFKGFSMTSAKEAYLDAIYVSLCDYIGSAPDQSIAFTRQSTRFLTVIQAVVSMFINVVIITKFVNTF